MEDKWIEGTPLKVMNNTTLVQENLHLVADLLEAHTNKWNSALIWRVFQAESANRILGMYVSQDRDREDMIVWSRNESGNINSKDAYSLLVEDSKSREKTFFGKKFWGRLWGTKIKPKWKVFVWRILNKALALNANREKR